jgi:hypothetical protein
MSQFYQYQCTVNEKHKKEYYLKECKKNIFNGIPCDNDGCSGVFNRTVPTGVTTEIKGFNSKNNYGLKK